MLQPLIDNQLPLKEDSQNSHRRYFNIAGITIIVESDLPVTDTTFQDKFALFRVTELGNDQVYIHHHFFIPDINKIDLGQELFRQLPWAIYRQNTPSESYIYLGISPEPDDTSLHRIAIFTKDHTSSHIYNNHVYENAWRKGGFHSLTMFPSDQLLIARLLAERQGCYIHSAGVIINGAGVLFVGHSEAGKSTTTNFLIDAASKREMQLEILCDDRNIVRFINDKWMVYGTWSHGDVPLVSPASAPLQVICFIEQSEENTITHITDRKDIMRRLLACVIRPFITADWWIKTLDLLEPMSQQIPCYLMRFDKSGAIVDEIETLIATQTMHSV